MIPSPGATHEARRDHDGGSYAMTVIVKMQPLRMVVQLTVGILAACPSHDWLQSCHGLHAVSYVSLSSGNISQLPSAPLSGFAGSSLLIDLSSNALDVLPGAILTQFHGFNLGLSVDNNRLKSLPAALFGNHTAISGIRLMSLAFNATANQISSVGPMFDDSFNPGFGTTILLSSNYISTNGLIAIVSSYTHAEGQLALYLDDNQVSDVPANLYDGVGAGVAPPVSVKITLKGNPLRKFSPSVFGGLAYLASTVLDVSFPTIPGLEIPTPIDFSSGVSFRPPATLRIRIAGTGVALSTAAAFSGFLAVPQNCNHSRGLLASRCTGCGPSCILTLDLSYNNITSAASGSLANAALTKLNLSNNGLRDFATDAFNNSRSLRELVLSYNALTVIPLEQRSNTPQLVRLAIDHNVIQAMPLAVNGIARPADAAANILTCVEYLPTATGCTCAAGFYLSELCGYVRCTAQPYGCRPPTLFNGTSCARSPWSTCVDPAITYGEAFYIEALHVFKPLSQCENQFAGSGGHSTPATYLVANYTTTSDRLCSICSVCPPSYKTTPCTATSDTVCDHEPYVAPEDWGTLVAFTVMCIVGCTLLAAITMKYRSKMRDLKDRLDSTRKTICTVREDRRRMDQAWAIKQTDLIFEREIGAGACGRVYEGKWGITPVAIKVLMTPMDTEMAREEFEREVDFMKWVRHPNLITFLGAGVGNFQSLGLCAFLVTELIEKGSLQEVLDDPSVVLVWPNRVQLAADIASALWYLHFIGSVHRDLKPDNCLVTHDMRAKVSDFGTSRVTNLDILDHFKRRGTLVQNLRSWSNISASSSVDDVMPSPSVNLTRHVGTLLWMAPEVLTDSVKIDQAWALDVYSFALVMYEMWSGVQPWSDLKCHPGEVFEELMNRVPHGERPRLPDARAPPDYAELVVQCWDPVAAKRPRFEEIVAVLRQLVARYRHYSLLPKEFGRGLGAEPGPIPPARAVIKLPQADQADPVIARSETVDHAGVQRSVKSAFVKRVFSRLRGVDHHPSCSNDESISAETPLLPKRLEHRHKSKSPHRECRTWIESLHCR